MLQYVRDLRARSVFPAECSMPFAWLDIGPGYFAGPAFGHIDLVHQILDFAPNDPELARRQLVNQFALQRNDGSMAFLYLRDNLARFWQPHDLPVHERLRGSDTFPPLWAAAVEACLACGADGELLTQAYGALTRMLEWFDAHRRAPCGGYFYADVLGSDRGDSGMDHSIRFVHRPSGPAACVDACGHVHWCLGFAAAWAKRLGRDPDRFESVRQDLGRYIQQHLFCEETGWFHDAWAVRDASRRHTTFERMWPLVSGAATAEQGAVALNWNLLNPERFLTPHPIATVAVRDPGFELRMWRGPAWNCMTLWATEACVRYGRIDGARTMLERALDRTAAEFARTGTIFEFYDPFGGRAETVIRKPGRDQIGPCRDYLGHNPLHPMARVWAHLNRETI
jgi:glycogen debranching enzyme